MQYQQLNPCKDGQSAFKKKNPMLKKNPKIKIAVCKYKKNINPHLHSYIVCINQTVFFLNLSIVIIEKNKQKKSKNDNKK